MRAILTSLLPIAYALGTTAAHADEHFKKAEDFKKAGQFAQALTEFETSNAAYPSLITLFNIGEMKKELGRPNDACTDYRSVLIDRAAAQKELGDKGVQRAEAIATLQCRLAESMVTTLALVARPPGMAARIDGHLMDTTPLPLGPGQHSLFLDLPAPAPPMQPVSAEPGRHRGWVFAAGPGAGANFQLGDDIESTQRGSLLLSLRTGYQINPTWRVGLDVHPLLALGSNTSGDLAADFNISFFPSPHHGYYIKAGGGIQGPGGIKAANTVNHVGILLDGGLGWEHLFDQHRSIGAEAWFGHTRYEVANVFNTALVAVFAYHL